MCITQWPAFKQYGTLSDVSLPKALDLKLKGDIENCLINIGKDNLHENGKWCSDMLTFQCKSNNSLQQYYPKSVYMTLLQESSEKQPKHHSDCAVVFQWSVHGTDQLSLLRSSIQLWRCLWIHGSPSSPTWETHENRMNVYFNVRVSLIQRLSCWSDRIHPSNFLNAHRAMARVRKRWPGF